MTNGRRILVAAVLLLMAGALACVGGPQKPSVEILSPPNGSQVATGEDVSVEYRASDATAVVRVELEVGGAVVGAQNSPVAEGQPVMNGVLTWKAVEAGSYTLIVRAYSRDRVASDPVGVSVTVGEGGAVPGSTVTISLLIRGGTQTPESTLTPESSATVPALGATTTATRPATAPSPTSTRPAAAPTATSTRPAPTPTQTQPPPTATATRQPPTPTATQPPPMASINVINHSGVDLCVIFISNAGASWGNNWLTGGGFIANWGNITFQVTPGNKDLLAGDCPGGNVVDDRYDVPVSGTYDWVIPPQVSKLVVVNECAEPIVYLYVDAYPGVNLVQEGAMFEGESRIFDVTPGIWTFGAYDQWNQMLGWGRAQFDPQSDVYWHVCG